MHCLLRIPAPLKLSFGFLLVAAQLAAQSAGRQTPNGNRAANLAIEAAPADGVQYVSPNGSRTNDGLTPGTAVWDADIGAALNKAYANLPSSGGVIFILNTQGCQNFTTPVVMGTLAKWIKVVGEGIGNTCLNYTATSGTAFTVDPGTTTVGAAAKFEDFQLQSTVSAATTVGLSVGPANGCAYCHFENVSVNGFQDDIIDFTFGAEFYNVHADYCSTGLGSIGFQTAGKADDTQIFGGRLQSCTTLLKVGTGNPFWATGLALVGNGGSIATTLWLDTTTAGAEFHCTHCHWVNGAPSATPSNWFNNRGNLFVFNSDFESDRTSGSEISQATSSSGQVILSGIAISSAGETAANFLMVTGGNVTLGFNFNAAGDLVANIVNPSYGGIMTEFGEVGGRAFNTGLTTKSSNYTLQAGDGWVNVTGTTTITAPHALIGERWVVFNSGSGAVTLKADRGNMNGVSSIRIPANAGMELACDGANCFAH